MLLSTRLTFVNPNAVTITQDWTIDTTSGRLTTKYDNPMTHSLLHAYIPFEESWTSSIPQFTCKDLIYTNLTNHPSKTRHQSIRIRPAMHQRHKTNRHESNQSEFPTPLPRHARTTSSLKQSSWWPNDPQYFTASLVAPQIVNPTQRRQEMSYHKHIKGRILWASQRANPNSIE